jgi:branched-chain amino acid transport system substrate-binding protein
MRRSRIVIALGVLVIAMATALSASAQNTVKLAIVAEITGGGAPSGNMWRDGVLLAVEELNKKGGIQGRRLESSVMDT